MARCPSAARRRPHPAHRVRRRRGAVGPRAGRARATTAGSAPARRSGRCTPTRPPWSAASGRCSCRRCTRRCWPASTSTPTTGRTRRAGCSAPPRSSPSRRSARRAQAAAACDRVRRAHAPVRGATPDGRAVRRRRPRAARLGAPRAGRLARGRGPALGRTGVRPGRLPRRHGRRRGAARRRRTCRTTAPGWPRPGRTTCRSSPVTEPTARGARVPARPAAAAPDPVRPTG